MIGKQQKHRWIIDAVLWVGFLMTFALDLTGLAVHQWLGVAVGLLAGYHLVSHRDWVKSVARRLFRTSGKACNYFLLDAGLLLGFTVILVTGLAISSWLNLPLGDWFAWRQVHVAASIATLGMVVIKLGIHWRWIVSTAQRFAPARARQETVTPSQQSATAPTRMGRRQFLALMGTLGVTTAVAVIGVLHDPRGVHAEERPPSGLLPETGSPAASLPTQQPDTANPLPPMPAEDGTAASEPTDEGTIRCPGQCTYPGRCRRYVDTNGNGLCDWGEPV